CAEAHDDLTGAGGAGQVIMSFSAVPVGGTGAAPIPTMSEWGLIALSSLLALFAFARVRRR
ncbi:MAG: IPTL-CTERM sorting domain-containing protein, partial [Comamonadaceae bacterium]